MLLKFLAVKTSFLSNECVFQRKTMHCFQKNQSKYVCFRNSNGSFFSYISKSVCFLFYESFIWLCKNLKIIVEKYVSKEQKAGISDASLHKKWSFPLRISSVNVTKSAVSCGFGPFTEEILNGKLHFLCSACNINTRYMITWLSDKFAKMKKKFFMLIFKLI